MAPLLSQVQISHPDDDHARLLQQQQRCVSVDATTRLTKLQS